MHARPIVIVGSSNTDMIVRVPRLPKPGETILGGEFFSAAGGKGANQAVAAVRAGGRVQLVARLGNDTLGTEALRRLRASGVGVKCVRRDATAASGAALIFLDHAGENCIAVAAGANAKLTVADIDAAATLIRSSSMLLLQLETPLPSVRRAVLVAARAGVPIILNPAPATALPDALLAKISILTPNETEAERLTGIKVANPAAARRACANLLGRGVRTVIVTLGARGAFVADNFRQQLVAGFNVHAVDTTAAGDVFNGALATALAEGRPLLAAVRFANAAGALSVMQRGAQSSAPQRAAIERMLRAVIPRG